MILRDITNDTDEDGYSIVRDFLVYDGSDIESYMHALKRKAIIIMVFMLNIIIIHLYGFYLKL